jgi:UDP-glucuronate 4-epimerase
LDNSLKILNKKDSSLIVLILIANWSGKMKVLVTGAAGFIGSHLCERLINEGFEVTGIDNFDSYYDRKIKDKNLENLRDHKRFNLLEEDLCNHGFLKEHFSDFKYDVVIHLAANAGVRPSLKNPIKYVRSNVEATVSLLDSMRDGGCTKLVFASSSSIYGTNKEVPFVEDAQLANAISIYATTKHSCELFNQMYHNLYNFDIINLRLFTVYGPRQRPDLAIHKFLKANLLDDEITLFGDGSMARDYTYVTDTVQGIFGAIKRINSENGIFENFNLGNSSPVTLKDLIIAIENVTGKKFNKKYIDVPPGDVPITYADISKAKEFLNYNPRTSLSEGLENFNNWIRTTYS